MAVSTCVVHCFFSPLYRKNTDSATQFSQYLSPCFHYLTSTEETDLAYKLTIQVTLPFLLQSHDFSSAQQRKVRPNCNIPVDNGEQPTNQTSVLSTFMVPVAISDSFTTFHAFNLTKIHYGKDRSLLVFHDSKTKSLYKVKACVNWRQLTGDLSAPLQVPNSIVFRVLTSSTLQWEQLCLTRSQETKHLQASWHKASKNYITIHFTKKRANKTPKQTKPRKKLIQKA